MPGQIYGLLGPNGAGKTTALRILSTVLHPTEGHATINGFDVVKQAEQVRRQIGFVSNNTAIYDRMTGWEMVEYFGRLHEIDRDTLKTRMQNIFDRFRMNDTRELLGSKMSTGMKQKISIARALVHDPAVLIFDEATLGLDLIVAREVNKTIESLRDQGKCIIFSSHVMGEIKQLCDRVAILVRGRIVAEGTLPELSQAYEETDFEELFYNLLLANDEADAEEIYVSTTVPDHTNSISER